MPFPGQSLGFRRIEAHGEVKQSITGRQPVGFQIAARNLILEID
jgi:hypothetical protein